MKSGSKLYFPNLDGLRTVAFLVVFFAHSFLLFQYQSRTTLIKVLDRILCNGDLGVMFFFVLSGFLISYLLLTELKLNGKINLKAFYIRRILRIWPVYFMVIMLALLLSFTKLTDYSLVRVNFPLTFTFLTNFDMAFNGLISSVPLTVLWSVAVEEQFYLVLPVLIILFGRKVFLSFFVLIALAFIYRYINADNLLLINYNTSSVCSSLLIGCILAYWVLNKNLISAVNKIPKKGVILIYVVLIVLILFRKYLFIGRLGVASDNLIFSIFFGFVIIEQNFSTSSFYKMKNFERATSIGKYTYGLYAYHIIFITLLSNIYLILFGTINNIVICFICYFISFYLSLVFSITSYNLLERKFLSLKEKLYSTI